jgi:hypothetical protein
MLTPLDHIECCNNEGSPELVIGSAYVVREVISQWWLQLFFGKNFWGVRVWGDDGIYHHSHFRRLTRSVTTTDFNMKQSPYSRSTLPCRATDDDDAGASVT